MVSTTQSYSIGRNCSVMTKCLWCLYDTCCVWGSKECSGVKKRPNSKTHHVPINGTYAYIGLCQHNNHSHESNGATPNFSTPHSPKHKGWHMILFLKTVFTVLILYIPVDKLGIEHLLPINHSHLTKLGLS